MSTGESETWHTVTLWPKYRRLDLPEMYICACGETEPVEYDFQEWQNGEPHSHVDISLPQIVADHNNARVKSGTWEDRAIPFLDEDDRPTDKVAGWFITNGVDVFEVETRRQRDKALAILNTLEAERDALRARVETTERYLWEFRGRIQAWRVSASMRVQKVLNDLEAMLPFDMSKPLGDQANFGQVREPLFTTVKRERDEARAQVETLSALERRAETAEALARQLCEALKRWPLECEVGAHPILKTVTDCLEYRAYVLANPGKFSGAFRRTAENGSAVCKSCQTRAAIAAFHATYPAKET